MKKIMLICLLLVSTLSFSHEKTKEDKKQMYEVIKTQLDKKVITLETAQKLWIEYIKCCKTKKEGVK